MLPSCKTIKWCRATSHTSVVQLSATALFFIADHFPIYGAKYLNSVYHNGEVAKIALHVSKTLGAAGGPRVQGYEWWGAILLCWQLFFFLCSFLCLCSAIKTLLSEQLNTGRLPHKQSSSQANLYFRGSFVKNPGLFHLLLTKLSLQRKQTKPFQPCVCLGRNATSTAACHQFFLGASNLFAVLS